MMISVKNGVLVNTDMISMVQLKEIKGNVRVELIIGNRSILVDHDKITSEFRDFLRGEFDDKHVKQFTSV